MKRRRIALAAGLFCLVLPATALAESCDPVVDPYEGTRYEGIDLTHIEARHVSCSKARDVVEKAHHKGLGLAPNVDGYLFFRSDGWTVKGNLRPDSDRYHAKRGNKLIRWRF